MNFENQIRTVVGNLFPQFDANKSDTLDVNELPNFFNTAFRALGYNITISPQEAMMAISKMDRTNDRVVNRE